MNIGEANDVNVVLDYFLELPRHNGPVTPERAKAAAVRLADRAYRALSAGSSGVAVAERFEELAAPQRPAEPLEENGPGVSIQ